MKLIVNILCLCLLYQVKGSLRPSIYYINNDAIEEYIINGEDAEKGRWPWMLSLEVFDPEFRHTCGATLLDSRHAITAAHCLDGRYPDMDFRVVVGASHRGDDQTPSDREDTVNVTAAFIYEDYCPGLDCNLAYPNDIAIMYLERDVEMNEFVQGAVLGDSSIDYVGLECWASGWGKLSGIDDGVPVKLQEVQIDVLSTEECVEQMPAGGGRIEADPHLCVYDYENVTAEEKKGICSGDSGGPLSCLTEEGEWLVIGAASWVIIGEPGSGNGCNPIYPGVYARVPTYLEWIREKIEDPSWKPIIY